MAISFVFMFNHGSSRNLITLVNKSSLYTPWIHFLLSVALVGCSLSASLYATDSFATVQAIDRGRMILPCSRQTPSGCGDTLRFWKDKIMELDFRQCHPASKCQ